MSHRLILVVALSFTACGPQMPVAVVAPPVKLVEEATAVTTVAFTEGPTADDAGNVYFTELMNQRILRMAPGGVVSVFREQSNNANGLIIDAQGRLVACEGANLKANKDEIKLRPRMRPAVGKRSSGWPSASTNATEKVDQARWPR